MEDRLLALDAQVPPLDEPELPDLDEVVYEVTTSEPLVSFVEGSAFGPPPPRELDPEALDPAIFAGLTAP